MVGNADEGALATNLGAKIPMASETASGGGETVATATGSTATGVKATAGEGKLAASISEEVGGVGETMSMARKDRATTYLHGKAACEELEMAMPRR